MQPTNIFTVWSDEITGRIDPIFYHPEFKEISEKLLKVKSISFGSIIKSITNGFDYRQFEDNGKTIYLRVGNIRPHEIIYKDVKKVNISTNEITKNIQLNKGDVLLTRKGSFGISVTLKQNSDALISSEIFLIRLNDKNINPNYIEIFLNSDICQRQFQNQKIGAIMGSLSQDAVKNILIPLPPLSIQNKIVEIMQNAYEEKRKKNEESKTILASIDDILLNELDIKIEKEENNKNVQIWEVWSDELKTRLDPSFYIPLSSEINNFQELKNYVKIQGGFAFKSNEYLNEGVPLIRIQNLNNGEIDLTDTVYIKPEYQKTLNRFLLQDNDLLIAMTGATIGKTAKIDKSNLPAFLNQRVGKFIISEKIDKNYLYIVLQTKFFIEQVKKLSLGGAQPNISSESIEKIKIPVPSLEKQKKITGKIIDKYLKAKQLQQETENVIAEAQKKIEQMIFE